MKTPVNIGISACLLGQAVRYDGAHKRHDLLLASAGDDIRWIAVCPEVELGLGVPREPIELVEGAGAVRLVTLQTKRDITVTMSTWAENRLSGLAAETLSGYVFKSRSPSCGLRGPNGPGMFAAAFVARFGDVPVIEESALDDAAACRDFMEHVRVYHGKLIG